MRLRCLRVGSEWFHDFCSASMSALWPNRLLPGTNQRDAGTARVIALEERNVRRAPGGFGINSRRAARPMQATVRLRKRKTGRLKSGTLLISDGSTGVLSLLN